jgi:hypothetical protein
VKDLDKLTDVAHEPLSIREAARLEALRALGVKPDGYAHCFESCCDDRQWREYTHDAEAFDTGVCPVCGEQLFAKQSDELWDLTED